MTILGTPHLRSLHDVLDRSAPWYLTCPAADCGVEMYGETADAAESNMVDHLRSHPDEYAILCVLQHVALEVYAQLEELSDDTCGEIGRLAPGDDPDAQVRFNNLHAKAEDLRETLLATLDVRLADWYADNAGPL